MRYRTFRFRPQCEEYCRLEPTGRSFSLVRDPRCSDCEQPVQMTGLGVMRMVDGLERAEVPWCMTGDLAVNHWAAEPMVIQDVDLVVASDEIERAVKVLSEAGFTCERHAWSINFKGRSQVSIQLSTEDFYREFPARSVPADVHGILMRVASLQDTLAGKIKAWSDSERRQSKRIKDLGDVARLVERHPSLRDQLPPRLLQKLEEQS